MHKKFKVSVTNSTEHSSFLKDNSRSASHEIPCSLWNPKVQYRVHNSTL